MIVAYETVEQMSAGTAKMQRQHPGFRHRIERWHSARPTAKFVDGGLARRQARSMIRTRRLKLLPWRDEHRAPFAKMHADPEVMADQGDPVNETASNAKLERYRAASIEHGFSRWAVETADGAFLGYTGVMPRLFPDHPLGPHFEIGWRFMRSAWGHGYATESATAALADAFRRARLKEVVSYTSADNRRSQAVMARLNLWRAPSRDFSATYESVGLWRGLVWVAHEPASAAGRTR